MRNNDYLSQINFKVKLHRQRLFYMNLQHRVHLYKKKSQTMKFYFEII